LIDAPPALDAFRRRAAPNCAAEALLSGVWRTGCGIMRPCARKPVARQCRSSGACARALQVRWIALGLACAAEAQIPLHKVAATA